jgi:Ran GTPase-activating protein (RanGAP) involved in mRNA processing and transport
LPALKGAKQLKTIDLSDNSFTDSGLILLGDLFKSTPMALESLKLNNIEISDIGFMRFIEYISQSSTIIDEL